VVSGRSGVSIFFSDLSGFLVCVVTKRLRLGAGTILWSERDLRLDQLFTCFDADFRFFTLHYNILLSDTLQSHILFVNFIIPQKESYVKLLKKRKPVNRNKVTKTG